MFSLAHCLLSLYEETTSNKFSPSLSVQAVADLLFGVLVFPLTMEFSIGLRGFHYDSFYRVRSTFDISLCTSSILNLYFISVDRYYAVCQPLKYTTEINDHDVVIAILVSWGLSVLIGIGFIVVGMNREKCSTTCLLESVITNILGPIFSFYFPVIIML